MLFSGECTDHTIIQQVILALWSVIQFITCPIIWLIKTLVDAIRTLVATVISFAIFLVQSVILCTKESVRSSFWITYFLIIIPLSILQQLGSTAFWLLRIFVSGIHFLFFVAFVNIVVDLWFIVIGAVHLICVFFGMIGLAIALVVSIICRAVALVVGLACAVVTNIMSLVSSVFGGSVMPDLL